MSVWYGLIAPAKLPRAILDRLHASVAFTLQSPEVRQTLTDLSLEIFGSDPQQFATVIRTDAEKWMRFAKHTKWLSKILFKNKYLHKH